MDTFATEVFKSFAIPENPGKYISIENGPRAVNEPKIRISLMYFFVVILKKGLVISCKDKDFVSCIVLNAF